MDGISIDPHHEVKQTLSGFFNDKDTGTVEYVLNELI